MSAEEEMMEAVKSRVGQLVINPFRELKPGEWNLILGLSPAALRRRWRYMPDIWGDVIFMVGNDQRTTLARYWRCQDKASKKPSIKKLRRGSSSPALL